MLQAPNVSLQQLIASFAAQSKQLGLKPMSKPPELSSIANSAEHDLSMSKPDASEHLDCSTATRYAVLLHKVACVGTNRDTTVMPHRSHIALEQ